jgi:hypothetical protein
VDGVYCDVIPESGEEGETARREPLLYQSPDKWGVVNLWLEQWSWNMMEQQMMTDTG